MDVRHSAARLSTERGAERQGNNIKKDRGAIRRRPFITTGRFYIPGVFLGAYLPTQWTHHGAWDPVNKSRAILPFIVCHVTLLALGQASKLQALVSLADEKTPGAFPCSGAFFAAAYGGQKPSE